MTTFAPEKTSRLTAAQVAHYETQGYVLFHQPVFAPEKFARLKSIFEESLAREGSDGMNRIHQRDPRLLEFLLADEVLDLIQPLVGPNIGLFSSHFISKEPHTGKATPWHEDSSYWDGRASTVAGICTVWLALDEATEENGCMRVIPGSHQGGFSDYEDVDASTNIFSSQIKAAQVDEDKAVYFALKPNECSLHESRMIHGARANTSNQRRAGYTMRYFPTSTKIYPEKNEGMHFWLARGKDIAGNTYQNAPAPG